MSLGARSLEPKFLPWQQSRVLIAGVSKGPSFKQEEPTFEELSNIELELDEVRKNTIKSELLYNEDFTKNSFENKVNNSTFPVLHIATHGIFSSDPEQTVILAAEALRKAQISFLKNPEHKEAYKNYAHPYYWAPFILVGSWL
ncbi:CHAT domain-containing protein [Kamptonema sp. UHCC 0994]|uniref:CHAT domain-containing protein n=1 Tax=Kamptonema sp. UHCC 0994 TaxID=3031329 RepID=UPI0023B96E86|nr:CHAT domain-containing protein [Kamptonema sp. UHCC 0994]MDF0552515.1 CHAT domain-containing protein [Kamptonema sp. UHCC 0994]